MGFESSNNLTVVICAPYCSWVITHACLTPTINFQKQINIYRSSNTRSHISPLFPKPSHNPTAILNPFPPFLPPSLSKVTIRHGSPSLPRMGVPNMAGLASLFLSTSESDHQVIKGGTVKWSSPQAANSLNPPLLDLGNQQHRR